MLSKYNQINIIALYLKKEKNIVIINIRNIIIIIIIIIILPIFIKWLIKYFYYYSFV